uniref:Dynein regulatory complex protein 10 n=1 Tax=Glossina morsitans morsitans TaxID=37546 RepID=A0A1B0GAZ9_GLOMM
MSKLSKTFGWLDRATIGRTSRGSRAARFSDFEDENEMKSALTYEQTLKLDNISKMITELNEKLQIALIIPQILENPKILGKSLKGTKYEPALKLVKEYRDEKINMRTPKPPEVNSSTNKIIDYFVENYEILKFLPDWVGDLDQNYQTLIKCLRLIGYVARGRFSRGALEQMERELVLQSLYNLNEQVIKDVKRINKLVLQFEALIRRYDEVMFEKFAEEILLDEAIEKLQQELDDFQPEFNREEQMYIELVVKKEEEYQRTLKIRAHGFRRNCAAKKIQVWAKNILRKIAKANLVGKEATGKKAAKKKK